jgi:hypothetical protein
MAFSVSSTLCTKRACVRQEMEDLRARACIGVMKEITPTKVLHTKKLLQSHPQLNLCIPNILSVIEYV